MTFITVIRSTTFPSQSVEVELSGTFTGNLMGNVFGATCITFEDSQGITIGNSDTSATNTDSISIGKGATANIVNAVAIGTNAFATNAERSFALNVNESSIDTTGDVPFLQAVINGTDREIPLAVASTTSANIISRCVTGSRVGTGNVTLGDSPTIPTDEVWGFEISVTGRETGTNSIFYEKQSILAFNNAGTVEVTPISTIASLGLNNLSGDSVTIQGNSNAIDVIVSTASTGTTNWTGKMSITSVS